VGALVVTVGELVVTLVGALMVTANSGHRRLGGLRENGLREVASPADLLDNEANHGSRTRACKQPAGALLHFPRRSITKRAAQKHEW
jgi:hypothetical protein